jgi:hypothetical protein
VDPWTITGAVAAVVALPLMVWIGKVQIRKQRHGNENASTLVLLEQERRHDELTPQFAITYRLTEGSDTVTLHIALVGPSGLDRLDGVEVTVRDDLPDRRPVIAGGPTQEEIASVIWGPYRLRPGVDGADRIGRQTPAVSLRRGEVLYRLVEPSLAPYWSADSASWRARYAKLPIRISLTCTRQGTPPWVIPLEVTIMPLSSQGG